MLALSLFLGVLPGVDAHAVLTMPASRNGGRMSQPANYQSTMYYTAPARTTATHVIGQNSPLRTEFRYYAGQHPWRAPGTAEIWSPCGMYCDNCQSPGGKDGRTLTATPRTTWRAGDAVEVAFGLNTNHGGGYSYRLCQADNQLTEECFAGNYLDFVGDTTWVQMGDDKSSRTAIKAKRTNLGVNGSMWTMCPVPNNCNGGSDCPFPPPMPGLYGHTHQTNTRILEKANFVDKVRIPKSMPPGNYVLSFRLDCEETAQVWSNCADVTIVGSGAPTPAPTPGPAPPPGPIGGGGGSCSDDESDCRSSKCCQNPLRKCYEKNQYWGSCVETCVPNQIQPNDPPQYQTPWSCKLLDTSPPPVPEPEPEEPEPEPEEPEPEPEEPEPEPEEPEPEPESEAEAEVSSGSCSAGYKKVDAEDACKVAADALGFKFASNAFGNKRPGGCSVHKKKSRVSWNSSGGKVTSKWNRILCSKSNLLQTRLATSSKTKFSHHATLALEVTASGEVRAA